MRTNFVFRNQDGAEAGSVDLLNKVVQLGVDLTLDGIVRDVVPICASVEQSSDGSIVIIPIDGPAGWTLRAKRSFAAYRLDCWPLV